MTTSSLETVVTPTLTLAEVQSLAPILFNWRNSKGRIMPLHLRSAPGAGKTVVANKIARQRALALAQEAGYPVPFGVGVFNVAVSSPTDAPGYVLFDSVTKPDGTVERVSTYTRPAMFGVKRAYAYDPDHPQADADGIVTYTRDVLNQRLTIGCVVATLAGGESLTLEHGVTIFDEFDQGDPDTKKVMASIFDEGRITDHTLPPDWACWALSNRAKDASGTTRQLAFLTNRWAALEVAPDFKALENFLSGFDDSDSVEYIEPSREVALVDGADGRIVKRDSNNFNELAHPAILAYARQQQDELYAGVPSDPGKSFLTARSLEALSNLFDVMLRRDALTLEDGTLDPGVAFSDTYVHKDHDERRFAMFTMLARATIGSENASQFIATLQLFGEVPTIAEIVADPGKAVVSTMLDAQMITGYMLASSMTLQNGDKLMRYAQRLNQPIYFNVPHNAVGRDGELLMVPAVAKFFADNPSAMSRMIQIRARAVKASRAKGR